MYASVHVKRTFRTCNAFVSGHCRLKRAVQVYWVLMRMTPGARRAHTRHRRVLTTWLRGLGQLHAMGPACSLLGLCSGLGIPIGLRYLVRNDVSLLHACSHTGNTLPYSASSSPMTQDMWMVPTHLYVAQSQLVTPARSVRWVRQALLVWGATHDYHGV